MGIKEKLEMFETLVQIGFKEIEVGFPSASAIEFDFIRLLIEEKRIPDDVTVQVLTQSREGLIRRTFEAIKDCHRAIVHLYNSTSPAQRRLVFDLDRDGIKEIAVNGTKLVKSLVATVPETAVVFEYSPESFSSTRLYFKLSESVSILFSKTESAKPLDYDIFTKRSNCSFNIIKLFPMCTCIKNKFWISCFHQTNKTFFIIKSFPLLT